MLRFNLKAVSAFALSVCLASAANAEEASPPHDPTPQIKQVENPLFGYTHLLPSPFTPPAGRLRVGFTTEWGITDSLSVLTNVLTDIFQIYNLELRYSLLDFPGLAAGLSLGFQYFNPNSLLSTDPSLNLFAWMPGGVIGVEVLPQVALFFGGNLFFPNQTISNISLTSSGYIQAAQIESDLTWAYHVHKDRIENALSVGASYNTTFSFYGVGISHHWRRLQLGFHYYPNASSMRFMPIFSTGAVINL